MELIEPDRAWLAARRPFVNLLAEAAASLGGRLEMESSFGHVGRYSGPDGQRRPIFGNALGVNADAAAALAADKDYTARLLRAAGLPAPEGLLVFAPPFREAMALKNAAVAKALPAEKDAEAFARHIGWPVIVKPNGGSEGRGVSRARSPADLTADLARLFQTDQKVRIEAMCTGADHRVVVFDGQVRIVYRRDTASVTGNGRHSVTDLLGDLRDRLNRDSRGPKLGLSDPQIARALSDAGLDLHSVPGPGQVVTLLPNANLSTGGRCTDMTESIAPDAAALAVRAAETLGLRLAGVDILASDLSAGAGDATVIEVNSAPGFDGFATSGSAQWERALSLVRSLLSADQTAP